MSRTIDERVVEMRFDNKQFERGAGETMSTLEKLKNALNFGNESKSLDKLGQAVNDVDMNPLANGVETVREKFSALEAMAFTALVNITNRVVDAGISLTKSLSVDQITAGWDKYAQKTSSVQTIMAATAKDFTDTGEQMEYVNAQLDKLNWFTDETSYNFLEMVNNIGKFTNNNIPLEQAVTSMEGISTWAALAGANSGEASRAMYNLAQAIAVGSVKLQDWKSIENANMATAEFKEIAMQTAVEVGTLSDSFEILDTALNYGNYKGDAFVDIANFSQTLSSGWFSTEVLTKTLEKYGAFTDLLYDATDAFASQYDTVNELLTALDEYQEGTLDINEIMTNTGLTAQEVSNIFDTLSDSTYELGLRGFKAAQEAKTFQEAIEATKDAVSTGWMNTFEIIFGDYETAKVRWTNLANELYDIFAAGAEARNELLTEALGVPNRVIEKGGWYKLALHIKKAGIPVDDFISKLIELGEEAGAIDGSTISGVNDFVASLEDGWLTTDMLTKALAGLQVEFPGIGDTLGDLSKVLGRTRSGSELLFDGISQGWSAIKGIFSAMKRGWEIAFPPMTAERLYNILEAFNSLSARFKEWVGYTEIDGPFSGEKSKTIENIKNTFAGLGSVVGIALDAVKAFASFMSKIFGDSIINGIDRLLEFTGNIGESLVNLRSWLQTNESFSKTFETISSWIDIAKSKFQEFIETVKIWFGLKPEEEMENVFSSDTIIEFSDSVNSRFRPMSALIKFVQTSFSKLGSVLSSVFPAVKKGVEKIGSSITSFMSAIGSAFSNGGFNAVLDLFNTGVMGAIGIAISKFLNGLGSIAKESGGFIGSLKSIGKSIVDTFGAIQTQLKSGALLKISIAIGILAAALVVLAGIPSEDLTSSLGAITVLFGDLIGSLALFNKLMNGSGMKSIRGVSTSMIGLSLSVLILASALKKIANIESDKLLAALGTVSALLAEMTAATILLSKYGGKIKTTSLSMIALAAAVLILTKAVKQLGDLDTAQLVKGLVAVGGLLAELAIFMSAAKFGGLKMTQATSLVILAEALVLLEGPLDHFSSMSFSQIGTGLLVMGGALAEIAIALKIMPKNSFSIGLGLLEVAGALTIINGVLSNMSGMTWDQIIKSLIMLGGALAELSIAMNLMKRTAGGAAAMLIMSTALLLLTPTLKSLSRMSWTEIATGLVALAGAFAVMGIAGAVLSPLIPAILGLSAAMALLGVGTLAVGAGILAFSTALGALSVAGVGAATSLVAILEILIVGLLNTIANSGEALGKAIKTVILAGCDALVTCVPTIAESVLTVIQEVLESLASHVPQIVASLLEFVISVIDALALDMPKVVESVINLITSLFSSIIDAIMSLDTTTIVKSLEGIGLLSAMMLIFAGLSLIGPEAMAGVVEFGIVIAELAVVLAAVGALSKIPGLTWIIGEGQELLQKIGTILGSFVGGIIGGVAKGITDQLPTIAENLSAFMEGLDPFLSGAKDIDTTSLESIKMLSGALLELTGTSLVDQISSFFGGGIDGLGEKLDIFAEAMVAYSDKITEIDTGAVTASATAGQALAGLMDALPKTGGLWQTIAGASDLNELSGKIVAYAEAITSYDDIIKGRTFDTAAIEASASAASGLIDLLNNMPRSGGLSGTILGNKTELDTFGETLKAFGEGLNGFCDVLGQNPDFSAIDPAVQAAGKLVDLQAALPKEDGWLTNFFGGGQTDLSEFGTQLSAFGTALSSFSTSVSTGFANTGPMNNAITVAESLIALASNESLGNSENLKTFGNDITTFSWNLSTYYSDISNIDIGTLSSVITQVNRLVTMASTLSGLDTSGMTGFGSALKTMADNGISDFCTAFENCTSQIQAAVDTLVSAAKTAISSKDGEFTAKGTTSATNYLNAISAETRTATTAGNTLSSNVLAQLTNKLLSFLTAGRNAASNYVGGFKSYYGAATTAGNTLLNNAVNAMNGYNAAYTQGKNLGSGFVAGIRGWKTDVYNAAYSIGRSAINGLQKSIDAHSPSREAQKMGDYTGVGYVNALLDYALKAYNAGSDVGTAALDGINKAITKISTIFDDDILTSPVIRPVVDLTDAQKSAQSISAMFNQSIGTTAAVAATTSASIGMSRVRTFDDGTNENESSEGSSGDTINQYNTFNITSDDPEEVANRVSYILQRQVERKESVWA